LDDLHVKPNDLWIAVNGVDGIGTTVAVTVGLERYHEAYPIPNTIGLQRYQYPILIPIPSMTSSEQHISVTNLFPPANVTATVIITADQTDGQ